MLKSNKKVDIIIIIKLFTKSLSKLIYSLARNNITAIIILINSFFKILIFIFMLIFIDDMFILL